MYERNFMPFIDACLNQSAELHDVESYVEYWHTHEINCSLQEYLGMSVEEYTLWLKNGDDALSDILKRRKDGEYGKQAASDYVKRHDATRARLSVRMSATPKA